MSKREHCWAGVAHRRCIDFRFWHLAHSRGRPCSSIRIDRLPQACASIARPLGRIASLGRKVWTASVSYGPSIIALRRMTIGRSQIQSEESLRLWS